MYQSDISKWCIQTVETPAGLIPLVQSSKCCCHRTEQSGIAAGLQSRCGGAALSPVHRELQWWMEAALQRSQPCPCVGAVSEPCVDALEVWRMGVTMDTLKQPDWWESDSQSSGFSLLAGGFVLITNLCCCCFSSHLSLGQYSPWILCVMLRGNSDRVALYLLSMAGVLTHQGHFT